MTDVVCDGECLSFVIDESFGLVCVECGVLLSPDLVPLGVTPEMKAAVDEARRQADRLRP